VLAASLLALSLAGTQAPAAALAEPGYVVLLGAEADASAVPELAGARGERLVLRIAAAGARDELSAREIALDPERRHAADDPDLIARVRGAGLVELEAAPLLAWLEALHPGGHESELVRALAEIHRRGAVIAGRGEAAALLSAATVVASASEAGRAECDPHELSAPHVAWGLGFQPWAVLDDAPRARGSVERLLEVLVEERLRLGFWLGERAALVVDRARGRIVARGEGACVVIDPRSSRSSPGSLRGARVTLLAAGDAWRRRDRIAELPQAHPPARRGGRGGAEPAAARGETVRDVARAFDPETWLAELDSSELAGGGVLVLREGARRVRLEGDADTRVRAPRAGLSRAAAGVLADFSWDPRGSP
jgi:cyanophycinase-like exopeptidase